MSCKGTGNLRLFLPHQCKMSFEEEKPSEFRGFLKTFQMRMRALEPSVCYGVFAAEFQEGTGKPHRCASRSPPVLFCTIQLVRSFERIE